MNKMKKILLPLLSLLFVVGAGTALVSCTEEENSSTSGSGSEITDSNSGIADSGSESTGGSNSTSSNSTGSDSTSSDGTSSGSTSSDSTSSGNTSSDDTEVEPPYVHTHEYGDWTETKAATCTEEGERQRTCVENDDTQTETIPALGHDWDTTNIVWTWSRYQSATATVTCKHDDTHKTEITATITSEVTKEATIEEAGERTYTAEITFEGVTYTDTTVEEIPKLSSEKTPSEGLAYTLSSDGSYYTVSGIGTCTDTEIVIPATYNDLPVTAIGKSAFQACYNFTSITIPNNITTIGNRAFSGCIKLTEINFNATACNNLSLNNYVFYQAGQSGEGIKVTVGANVTKIPAYLFCPYNDSFYVPKITSVEFAEGSICESIGKVAFWGCSSLESITIPDSVTLIGEVAFYECSSLTSITIPDSVTTIGGSAFSGCSNLTSITIPEGVTSIEAYAFDGTAYYNNENNWENGVLYIGKHLIKAKTILSGAYSIKDGTLTIADSVFWECSSLESVTIPEGLTTIGSEAFYGCSSLISVTIPESVTTIGRLAFADCSSLESITIPEGVTTIGGSAFYECSSLTGVYITDIAAWYGISFDGSYSNPLTYAKNLYLNGELVTELVISDSVTEIGNYVFSGCSSLISITIPNSVTSIGDYAFYYCSSLESITIPNSVTRIWNEAFNGCSSLTGVYITDIAAWCGMSFTNSYSNPLTYAKNLYLNGELVTELVIPESVTSIGNYAFQNCRSLENITIPDSVTSIGDSAFNGCSRLKSITIPDSVTMIRFSAFRYCSSLISIMIPERVTMIGSSAFYGCSSLESIEIPENVIMIGTYAFYDTAYYNNENNWENGVLYIDKHLIQAKNTLSGEYSIKDGTLTIADRAFLGCSSLESIVIPESVTTIGSGAFLGCSSLESITIPNSVTTIGSGAFVGCSSLTSITIPESVTTIETGTFIGCNSLTSITIPESVTTIGSGAFYGCSKLTSVTFENTSGWWYASSSTATSGTSISSEDLSDLATAATYLTSTYFGYYWKRS